MSRSESLRGNRNAVGRHTMTCYRGMTRERAEEVRASYAAGEKQASLAERYGMTQGSVSRIVNGWVWI